jgi:hypothetical protein
MFLRVSLAPDCLPCPTALELPSNPSQGPDFDLLPGVLSGKESAWKAAFFVCAALEGVQDLPPFFVTISIDAEYEQVRLRKIVENTSDLLPLLYAFPASRVWLRYSYARIRFAQFSEHGLEQWLQDKSIIYFILGDDNDVHADGFRDSLEFADAKTSSSSGSGCMK